MYCFCTFHGGHQLQPELQDLVVHLQLVLPPTDSPFQSSKAAANNICNLEQFKISN
jgi:hypothetical protein